MLMALLPLSALCADINLVFRHGEPIQDREAAWEGHIDFASWIDDEIIVYLSRGTVTCISIRDSDVKWTVNDIGKISDWSVSRRTKRLAILGDNDSISVIAHKKNATLQRNSSLEFSPSGDRILVASWDNTLSVYSIAEDGQ